MKKNGIHTIRSTETNRRQFMKLAGAAGLGTSALGGLASADAAPKSAGPAVVRSAQQTIDKIVIGYPVDTRTLLPNAINDATTTSIIDHLFDPITRLDPATNYLIGPWLADVVSVDDVTWDITVVQEGITFHNGEPVDAESIKAAIDYALDPANESHYLARYEPIVEMSIESPLTLRVVTNGPFPDLPGRLAQLYPLPPKLLAEQGPEYLASNPVGCGPFKFKEWSRDERVVLERNPDYWHNTVHVNEVEFRTIPEGASRIAALLNEEIHLVRDVPMEMIDPVTSSGHSRIEAIPSARTNYVALVNNREGSLMADPRVRQAVNYGVNIQVITESFFGDLAPRLAGIMPSNSPEFNTDLTPYPYDPDLARELLAETGIDFSSQTIVLDSPNGRYPMDADAAVGIAADLQNIGLNVEVQFNEWGNHLEKVSNRQTGDMFLFGWGPSMDCINTLPFVYKADATYSGYSNPEVEDAINEAMVTMDAEARQNLWNEAQRLAFEDAAILGLWQRPAVYGVSNAIKWEARVDDLLWMGDVEGQS
ncbi:MAG: hypothetical protein IT335_04845 [Thermomicrobiales bacterium]|nr:hypothetical protein [Thermomicrobiales bacterium]